MSDVPTSKSSPSPDERTKLKRIIARRGLCGLANDTKWDELISVFRSRDDWYPAYRCKCIDSPPSSWEREWFYHLPFPLLSMEWLDVGHLQQIREHRLPPRLRTIDHSEWIEDLLKRIGLEYQKGAWMIRIFGYSPKDMQLFDDREPSR